MFRKKGQRLSLKRHKNKGFTIIEVMVAFAVLVVVLGGMTMSLTASMRLNGVQKQRALAQDITRDVISRYLKNEDFDAVNPFDTNDPATYFGTSTTPWTEELYKVVGSTETNNLDDYGLEFLKTDLQRLDRPTLVIEMRPIKNGSAYYTTKLNAIVKVTWDGSRVVEMPAVIGQGDVTRSTQGILEQPTAIPTPLSPTPTPTPTGTAAPTPTPTPTGTAGPTPTPTASNMCLPAGTVGCGTSPTCAATCCSGNSTNNMGTRTCS